MFRTPKTQSASLVPAMLYRPLLRRAIAFELAYIHERDPSKEAIRIIIARQASRKERAAYSELPD